MTKERLAHDVVQSKALPEGGHASPAWGGVELIDDRPEAVAQRRLLRGIGGSPQVERGRAYQAMANAGTKTVQARFATVQRNEAPSAASRRNETGLPDSLKAGVESLSGMAMDHVKVHYNSDKPAAMQAHAYAQGSDIHVAPGQEKHLPHEAWHIVQQAQGRVRPTMQMKQGTPVNDDAGLESEADTMGSLALGHGASLLQRFEAPPADDSSAMESDPLASDLAPMPTLAAQAAPVQRKMGFEFETDYTFEIWKNEAWEAVGRTKGNPFYQGDGFAVEGDTHDNCEFILDPFDTDTDGIAAAEAAVALTDSLDDGFDDEGYVVRDVGGNWKRKTRIKDNKNGWAADAQVTQGVKLADLPKYIGDHLDRDQKAAQATRVTAAGFAGGLDPEVRGLVEMIIQFVADFKDWDGENADEGPKNAQAWMARTRYSDMAQALGPKLAAFKALFLQGEDTWKPNNPITNATGVAGGTRVIPNRYSLGEEGRTTGSPLTLKQWIIQLCDEGTERDGMSPPQGWAGGNYGMGYMGMDAESADDPLVLLEYRQTDNRTAMGETSGKSVPAAEWPNYVSEQFEKAYEWNSSTLNRGEPAADGDGGSGDAQ